MLKFSEACSAYGEGLKYDNSNYVLYCNRAISDGTEIMQYMLDSIIYQRESCQDIKQHERLLLTSIATQIQTYSSWSCVPVFDFIMGSRTLHSTE